MKYVCALITVSNMERSVVFYRDILNQEIEFNHGENVAFRGGFALHLDSHFEKLIGKRINNTRNHSTELYFEHDNLVQIRDILVENGYDLLHDIQEQPWKQMVLRVYDPDGHIVEIGESMEFLCYRLSLEGIKEEDISILLNMSIKFVSHSIIKYKNNSV